MNGIGGASCSELVERAREHQAREEWTDSHRCRVAAADVVLAEAHESVRELLDETRDGLSDVLDRLQRIEALANVAGMAWEHRYHHGQKVNEARGREPYFRHWNEDDRLQARFLPPVVRRLSEEIPDALNQLGVYGPDMDTNPNRGD